MTLTIDRLERLEKFYGWVNRYFADERSAFFDLSPLKEEVAIFDRDICEVIYTRKGEFWGMRIYAPNYEGGTYFSLQFKEGKCPSPILFTFKRNSLAMMRLPKQINLAKLPLDDGESSSLALLQIAENSGIKSFKSEVLFNNLGAVPATAQNFKQV